MKGETVTCLTGFGSVLPAGRWMGCTEDTEQNRLNKRRDEVWSRGYAEPSSGPGQAGTLTLLISFATISNM